jgi:hypothetical protein
VSQPEGRKDGYTEEGYKKVALNATLPKPTEGEGGKEAEISLRIFPRENLMV